MEWNTKWDWENLDIFNSKGISSPKKLQSTDWGIEEGEEDIDGSFNLSGVVGGSGGSASDLGNNSSAKSSISASTESSIKEGMKGSNFSFEGFGCFPVAYGKKKEFDRGELNGTSPLEASVCSGEPFIGLKLGKRTYFENNYAKSTSKTSLSGIPISSGSTGKKVKSSCQSTPTSRCQVEGCNLDLSSAKEYHRKHRVCESHSKCPKVIVAGLERRFCQQCSRFHSMSEFDEEKRSCRRRLSDHNARRRKPQQEIIRFNSTNPYPSFYDAPLVQTKPAISSTWESTCNSKYSVAEVKAEKSGDINSLSHSVIQLPDVVNMPSKSSRAEIFYQGFKESSSSNADALDLRRALSLLSNSSWGSCEPNFIALDHPVHSSSPSMSQHGMHNAVPQGLPEYWQADQQSIDPCIHALATKASNTNNHFQEFQIFKAPYETRFYSTPMDDVLKPL